MTAHSFLTVLSPIEWRANDPENKIKVIRDTLQSHEQENSPFRNCPMVHMARVQIIDQLTPTMGDRSETNLKTKYLLFVADIDGSTDDFLDCLYRENANFVQNVWGRCAGYPDYSGAVFFRRFIHRCMFSGELGYAGFPASAEDTITALTQKKMLATWVRQHQGLSNEELQRAWQRDREKLANPDVVRPGSL
jgi:hypothetical protein